MASKKLWMGLLTVMRSEGSGNQATGVEKIRDCVDAFIPHAFGIGGNSISTACSSLSPYEHNSWRFPPGGT